MILMALGFVASCAIAAYLVIGGASGSVVLGPLFYLAVWMIFIDRLRGESHR